MKVMLLTAGSRGDVEPFIALAAAVTARGDQVQVAAPEHSGVAADGVDLVSLGVDYSAVIESQGVSPIAAMRSYRTTVQPLMRGVIMGAVETALAFRPDVIVAHPRILSAPLIAEALDIPFVLAELVPTMTPTREFPAVGTVSRNLGPLNWLTYLSASAASSLFRGPLKEARRALGLRNDQLAGSPAATLIPVSPELLHRPHDWPQRVHLTGPWSRPTASTELDPAIAEFIDDGPFIYAGFGSMAQGDAAARGRALVTAARRRGQRLLIAKGLGGTALAREEQEPTAAQARTWTDSELRTRYGIDTDQLDADPDRVREHLARMEAERSEQLAAQERQREAAEREEAARLMTESERLDVESGRAAAATTHGPDPEDRAQATAEAERLSHRPEATRDDSGLAYDSAERRIPSASELERQGHNERHIETRMRADVAQGHPATDAVKQQKATKARKGRLTQNSSRQAHFNRTKFHVWSQLSFHDKVGESANSAAPVHDVTRNVGDVPHLSPTRFCVCRYASSHEGSSRRSRSSVTSRAV